VANHPHQAQKGKESRVIDTFAQGFLVEEAKLL